MAIDIYHSRRGKFRHCYWYEKTKTNNLAEYIAKERPKGEFYAEEQGLETNQQNQISNTMMFDKNMITLVTNDDLNGILQNCIVEYMGKPWIVDTVQIETHKKESEFEYGVHATWYITIRR